jgi:phospholipase C
MSTCTRWVDDLTITCTDWAQSATQTCAAWSDQGSEQCQSWADDGSDQCQSWADEGSEQCQSWADEGSNQCCDWAPCSWFCSAYYWVANWVCQGWYWAANWVCQAWYWVANWVCQAWYWVANWICVAFFWVVNAICVVWSWSADWVCVAWDTARCAVSIVLGGSNAPSGPIKHVFVLMLENRAFDHMLGFAGIDGSDAVTGEPTHVDDLTRGGPFQNPNPKGMPVDREVPVSSPADFTLHSVAPDPGHEFNNALLQLCGYGRDASGAITLPAYPAGGPYPPINNQGFIGSYFGLSAVPGNKPDTHDPQRIMKCFTTDQLPILTTLAKTFAVCDRWFSSMPGPTWPNRFFIHAASSGGLDDSPSSFETFTSTFLNGYRFQNGTIFDRLDDACLDWTVFMGDEFPQVFAISGMTDRRLEGHFKDFDDFATAVNDPGFSTPYVFIEPNYGNVLPTTPEDFTCGTSQHPLDDVTRGERLIKKVYEAIRNSPNWNESLLLVVYDEQGGFFDHAKPPPTVAPGDVMSDLNNNTHGFNFEQLGIRVPAVAISPLIPDNQVDHTIYDHSSLPATVEKLFNLSPLTKRDAAANNLTHLLSLGTPRTDAPGALPEPAESGFRCVGDHDLERAPAERTAPVPPAPTTAELATRPVSSLSGSERGFLHIAFLRDYHRSPVFRKPRVLQRFLSIKTALQAREYIESVRDRFSLARRKAAPATQR